MTVSTLEQLGCNEAIGPDSAMFRATRYEAISNDLIDANIGSLMESTKFRIIKTQALTKEMYHKLVKGMPDIPYLNTTRILSARYYTTDEGYAEQILVRADNPNIVYINEDAMSKYEAHSYIHSKFEDVDKRNAVFRLLAEALAEAADLYEPKPNTMFAVGMFLAGVAIGVAAFALL